MARIESTLNLILDVQTEALRELKKVTSQMDKMKKSADSAQRPVRSLWKQFAVGALVARGVERAIGGVINAFTSVVKGAIQAGSEFEQTKIAFEVMLGSAERGQQVLKELSDFAIRTPFEITEIEQNAKQLLAMGIQTEKLIPTLKALGDVSAGINRPLERIALNFGQVATQGKLTGRELKDFAVLGVPLIEVLADQFGVARREIQDMVSAGEIGFDAVEKAFITMTSEGGKFANLMERQSTTLAGMFSNLQDAVTRFFREAGEEALGPFKDIVDDLLTLLEDKGSDLSIALRNALASLAETAAVLTRNFIGFVESGALEKSIEGFGSLALAIGRAVGFLGQLLEGLDDFQEASQIALEAAEKQTEIQTEAFQRAEATIQLLQNMQRTENEGSNQFIENQIRQQELMQERILIMNDIERLQVELLRGADTFRKAEIEGEAKVLAEKLQNIDDETNAIIEKNRNIADSDKDTVNEIIKRAKRTLAIKQDIGEEEFDNRVSILKDLEVEDAFIKEQILRQSGELSRGEIQNAVAKANAQIKVANQMRNQLARLFSKTIFQNVVVRIVQEGAALARNPIQSIMSGRITEAVSQIGQGFKSAFNEATSLAKQFTENVNKELEKVNIADSVGGGRKAKGGKSEAEKEIEKQEKELEKLRKAVSKTWEDYGKLQEKARDSLEKLAEDHINNIRKIDDEITGLQNNLLELQRALEVELVGIGKGQAAAIVEQRELIKDLQDQIKKGREEGEDVSDLEARLAKEQAALNKSLDLQKELSDEIAEEERRRSLTGFERTLEDFKARKELALQEFEEKKQRIDDEIALLEEQKEREIQIFNEKKDALASVLMAAKEFEDGFIQSLENVKIRTEQDVAIVNSQLAQLEAALARINELNAAGLQGATGRALLAGGAPGGETNINVTITGNTIGGDQASAEQLAAVVTQRITRDIQLQNLSSQ